MQDIGGDQSHIQDERQRPSARVYHVFDSVIRSAECWLSCFDRRRKTLDTGDWQPYPVSCEQVDPLAAVPLEVLHSLRSYSHGSGSVTNDTYKNG